MEKLLSLIAILFVSLSGFSIQLNSFHFEWVGLLEQILRFLSSK